MSVTYSIKITSEEEKKKETDVEDFIHRYRNFMNLASLSTVDSVTMYEFKRQAREFLMDQNLDNYFKNIIRQMEMNAKTVEERKQFIIYEMNYKPLWYF
ncbi:MAG: hypothetical protein QXK24_00280 [Ignisphaera sp.]|uniref:Uncharacterized protein n=1 Tax=Ignisphaera aggregans TaxID=334771 RepID=A0A7C4H5W2_9CREN